ncbi:MAG: DUF4340 domain-containing protein [Bdellovibrionaceae bacterium]|nr:DUF4340 domain-containing protein [Pseudobdellovibrionaceae bacterium]
MKWFKKNGILLSVFLILGLFSFFEFQKTKTIANKKQKSGKLFSNISKRSISGINFYLQSQLDYKLTRKKKKWFVTKANVQDKADPVVTSIFLRQLFTTQKEKITSPKNLVNYQLDSPKRKIVFYDANNKKIQQLFLGAKSFDKRRFVLLGEKKDLFLASSHLNFITEKTFSLFRLKKLFFLKGSFDKIIIKKKGRRIVLYKKNNLWKGALNSFKNNLINLDEKKVDEFISTIKHLEAKTFIKENSKKSKKLLQQYKLLNPELVLSVFLKAKKIWTIAIAQDRKKSLTYAKTSERSTIYSLFKKDYKSLSVSLDNIRDRSSVFKINTNSVDAIFYQRGKRKRSAWHLLKGQWFFSKQKPWEKKKVEHLFSSIAQLKVVKFIPKKTIKKPMVLESLSFTSKNKPVASIQVRGYISSQKKNNLKDLVLLDLKNSQEYFTVSSLKWKALTKAFLLKSKKQKKK